MDALLPELTPDARERGNPFDQSYRVPVEAAKSLDFFKDHYGFSKLDRGEEWRRIDTAWLENAEKLALAVNNYTNNTSLALAFEFVDTGEVLLFPGDAQVGSWLTWHDLTWKIKAANGEATEVKIQDLFARTVFYKGSHHASHNGTLSGLGLELMNHKDLVVVVPVDKEMSKKKHWDRTLPWQPLLDRMQEKTRGAVGADGSQGAFARGRQSGRADGRGEKAFRRAGEHNRQFCGVRTLNTLPAA